jgi:hypothetical protein
MCILVQHLRGFERMKENLPVEKSDQPLRLMKSNVSYLVTFWGNYIARSFAVLHNRRSKLPATRVGAKFDHTEEVSANWLPTFGRVWNKNRKSHVRSVAN